VPAAEPAPNTLYFSLALSEWFHTSECATKHSKPRVQRFTAVVTGWVAVSQAVATEYQNSMMKPPSSIITRAQCRCGEWRFEALASKEPTLPDTCLYLWGGRERARSHLLQAACHALQRWSSLAMYLPLGRRF